MRGEPGWQAQRPGSAKCSEFILEPAVGPPADAGRDEFYQQIGQSDRFQEKIRGEERRARGFQSPVAMRLWGKAN
jgi:hypothetical protein